MRIEEVLGIKGMVEKINKEKFQQEPVPEAESISDPIIEDGDTVSLAAVMYRQGLRRNPAMIGKTFANFQAPTVALQARKKLAAEFVSRGCQVDNLFFFGPPGRGKTHLAIGIMEQWIVSGRRAIYWPLMGLIAKLKGLMGGHNMETPDTYIDFLCRWQGLLIMDELGRTRGEVWDRDTVIYQILDRRQRLPTIWISNYDLAGLKKIYDEAISSRLMSGKVVSFPADQIQDWRR